MKTPINSPDQEQALGVLHSRGLVSAQELMHALGKSQPTVSRLLSSLSGQVLTLGHARARRYGLPRAIRGLSARQTLWWTDEQGVQSPLGVLTLLSGGVVHVESLSIQIQPAKMLPWFLAPLRAQGFLGRLHARRLGPAGVGGDPEQWDLESTLFSAWHLHDAPGAITLGDAARPQGVARLPAPGADLAAALDRLAQDVAGTLPAGSSAAGEQPKFLAVLQGGQHVLVKFTPPRPSPFGDRWHDLLWAEWLAGRVLADHGFEVALAGMVQSARRTYLVSQRFDRTGVAGVTGATGRRHVLAIGDVHSAFVADAYSHWAATAAELQRQGRMPAGDAQRAAALLGFGRLVGNTDMHSGNLGLMVGLDGLAKGRFRLAPVYDMLPMRWKPNLETGGAADYTPFEPERSPMTQPSLTAARDYWQRLAALDTVSTRLRAVAAEMARRVGVD